MRLKIWLLAFLVFLPIAASAQTEWLVQSDQIEVAIEDSQNFHPDGTPIAERWGLAIYEIAVKNEDETYSVEWSFSRLDTSTNKITCSLSGDRKLPEPGKYTLDIAVWNRGVEGGQLVTKKSGAALRVLVNYTAPETPLVIPADLIDENINILEDETSFE